MTKPETAYKLLIHGPLTVNQFIEVTGWTRTTAYRVLHLLREAGDITPIKLGRWLAYQA